MQHLASPAVARPSCQTLGVESHHALVAIEYHSPMPFVVTEACIRCKYTDCVNVCPMDCFLEGPNSWLSILQSASTVRIAFPSVPSMRSSTPMKFRTISDPSSRSMSGSRSTRAGRQSQSRRVPRQTTKRGLPSRATFIFYRLSRSRVFVNLSARASHRLEYAPS